MNKLLIILTCVISLPALADGDYSMGYRQGFADGYSAGKKECGDTQPRQVFHRCNLRANAIDNWSDWQRTHEDAEQQAYDRCLANPKATKNWCDVFRSDTKCYEQ